MRPRTRQLALDDARPTSGHGGWRPHAGRPRGRTSVAHREREALRGEWPLLVTLRVAEGVALRARASFAVIVEAVRGAQKDGFRIVHFNVLGNHCTCSSRL